MLYALLTLDPEPHGVPGGGPLAGDPGTAVGPGVLPLQAGEDELLPGHTGRAVRQGPAFPGPDIVRPVSHWSRAIKTVLSLVGS